MNFFGGGERHNSADYRSHRSACTRSADSDSASPGDLAFLGRPGDVRKFVHRSFIGRAIGGVVSSVVGSVPLVGGVASGLFDRLRGEGASVVPQVTACPPGFINVGGVCSPRALVGGGALPFPQPRRLGPGTGITEQFPGQGTVPQPTSVQAELRNRLGRVVDPAAGIAVMGRFGAGFEPEVIMTDTRRCGRGAVLGVDGLCYNRRDLRNSDRFWPRGRRPLLTGGEVRAISVASSAAKKLERKQKQLMELGLLKRPTRSRRAAPAGHKVHLHHDGGSQH